MVRMTKKESILVSGDGAPFSDLEPLPRVLTRQNVPPNSGPNFTLKFCPVTTRHYVLRYSYYFYTHFLGFFPTKCLVTATLAFTSDKLSTPGQCMPKNDTYAVSKNATLMHGTPVALVIIYVESTRVPVEADIHVVL